MAVLANSYQHVNWYDELISIAILFTLKRSHPLPPTCPRQAPPPSAGGLLSPMWRLLALFGAGSAKSSLDMMSARQIQRSRRIGFERQPSASRMFHQSELAKPDLLRARGDVDQVELSR